jgi:Fe-S-cluster-containing dehydrogenase component
VAKSFFVPKLCNHCAHTPCTQVCPVGASFTTKDGVVLVDGEHCIGCGYCVQACPYGSRYFNPDTHTADKCTLCYHRITKGRTTACVESCPVAARRLGDRLNPEDPVNEILATQRVLVLQPQLLTKPQCFYLGLDMEVR